MQTCCVNSILVLCFIFYACFTLSPKFLNSLSSPQRKCVCLWFGTIGEIGIRGKTWLWFCTVQVWDAWLGTKGTLNPWSSALNLWQAEHEPALLAAVYNSISSCCPGFIPWGSFHKLIALPIIFAKILAHLGTLEEAHIGLEPLQLPNFFQLQTSIKSQWKHWIFHELANTTTSSCLLFLVLSTPTYVCAHPGVVPETPVWKQIFLKAFSEGSCCQTFQKYIKKKKKWLWWHIFLCVSY